MHKIPGLLQLNQHIFQLIDMYPRNLSNVIPVRAPWHYLLVIASDPTITQLKYKSVNSNLTISLSKNALFLPYLPTNLHVLQNESLEYNLDKYIKFSLTDTYLGSIHIHANIPVDGPTLKRRFKQITIHTLTDITSDVYRVRFSVGQFYLTCLLYELYALYNLTHKIILDEEPLYTILQMEPKIKILDNETSMLILQTKYGEVEFFCSVEHLFRNLVG